MIYKLQTARGTCECSWCHLQLDSGSLSVRLCGFNRGEAMHAECAIETLIQRAARLVDDMHEVNSLIAAVILESSLRGARIAEPVTHVVKLQLPCQGETGPEKRTG